MAQGTSSVDHDPRITRVIRDPVHGYVVVPEDLTGLIDHPYVQRLRRVAQTSMASVVMPSLTGSRFEHSLGTMHLARVAWNEIWAKLEESVRSDFMEAVRIDLRRFATEIGTASRIDNATLDWIQGDRFERDFSRKMSLGIGAAALLHDLGHTPFSHALEGFFERNMNKFSGEDPFQEGIVEELDPNLRGLSFHELAGLSMMSQIEDSYIQNVPFFVSIRILSKGPEYGWERALYQIVSSEVDVDRMDYLMRDASRAGSEFGAIDHDRLIQSIELHEYRQDKNRIGWRVGF